MHLGKHCDQFKLVHADKVKQTQKHIVGTQDGGKLLIGACTHVYKWTWPTSVGT